MKRLIYCAMKNYRLPQKIFLIILQYYYFFFLFFPVIRDQNQRSSFPHHFLKFQVLLLNNNFRPEVYLALRNSCEQFLICKEFSIINFVMLKIYKKVLRIIFYFLIFFVLVLDFWIKECFFLLLFNQLHILVTYFKSLWSEVLQ